MKIIRFTLVLLFVYSSCFATNKFSGIYYCDDKDVSYYIEFQKNGCYTLELGKNITNDIFNVTILSYGKFTSVNNIITLIDDAHGFKMKLKRLISDQIVFDKGFSFLKDKDFRFRYDSHDLDCIDNNIDIKKQKQERDLYKQSHKILYPIQYTTYESVDNTFKDGKYGIYETDRAYKFEINKDYSYRLYYKKVLVSEGVWKRDKNELLLLDEYLKHTFYMLISKDGLISKYLPGDYEGCLFLINQK